MGEENTTALIPSVIVGLTLSVSYIVALWKVYTKAGKPGWAAIIPIYNMYILLKIAGKPGWWLLFYLIPFVNFIVHLVVSVSLAKAFNRSSLFGIVALGFFSFIGYLILGFGKSAYTGVNPSIQTVAQPQHS